ncbi:MAG TPA: hypothetical protein VLA91_04770 [Acidimicrobiia bacterium]|nr:hypothetical protein [Acidimicrobiia bacterium]
MLEVARTAEASTRALPHVPFALRRDQAHDAGAVRAGEQQQPTWSWDGKVTRAMAADTGVSRSCETARSAQVAISTG